MAIVLDGTAGITTPDVESSGPVSGTNFSYTGTLTGGTGVVNLGSGQVYKDASGNVGIGTSSPGQRLDVNGIIRNQIEIRLKNTASNVSYVTFEQNASTNSETYIEGDGRTAGRMSFYTANTERMRIDSSGNLLVACTAAPSSSVAGVRLQNPNTAAPSISVGATTSSITMVAFINGNGTVGQITTNASATAYVTSSDYRLKHDIQPMTGALAKVAQLKPVTYKWNADDSESQGFIAHELQEVVPECVTGEKDAVDADGKPVYQGIDTSFLVATLTAAIQELKAIVDAQGAEIAALKGTQP